MAGVRGDLSVLGTAHLVQALMLEQACGLLTLEAGNDRRVLRISPAGLRLVRGSHRCHRMDRLLRRTGQKSSASSHLIREWVFGEICEAFAWAEGAFVFENLAPSELPETGPFAGAAVDCDLTSVALEAARRADELPRIKAAIRDSRQVPIRTDAPLQNFGLDPEAVADVLQHVDGVRPIVHLLQLTVFPRFVVLEVIYRMMQGGVLRLVAAPAATAAA